VVFGLQMLQLSIFFVIGKYHLWEKVIGEKKIPNDFLIGMYEL
jgi:hypothetical protein